MWVLQLHSFLPKLATSTLFSRHNGGHNVFVPFFFVLLPCLLFQTCLPCLSVLVVSCESVLGFFLFTNVHFISFFWKRVEKALPCPLFVLVVQPPCYRTDDVRFYSTISIYHVAFQCVLFLLCVEFSPLRLGFVHHEGGHWRWQGHEGRPMSHLESIGLAHRCFRARRNLHAKSTHGTRWVYCHTLCHFIVSLQSS